MGNVEKDFEEFLRLLNRHNAAEPQPNLRRRLSTAFHNYGDVWRPRFELISRNDDEGVPERYVEAE